MNRMLDVSQMEIMVMLATHMVRSWKSANRTWTEQYQYLLALLRHGAFRRNPRYPARDLDWFGFSEVSGKENYAVVGADFKTWGLRFWQRLFAVWQMSSGDWTEVFKMIALSGELEDIALVYFEKMLAGRTAVSNALDHTMNSMLILYMAPMSSAKSIERMSKEKSPIKTMPEHYQILVSALPFVQNAMLMHLITQRTDHLQQAAGLISFAIEYEADPGQRVQRASIKMLKDTVDCDPICRVANGGSFYISMVGTVKLRTIIDGNEVVYWTCQMSTTRTT
ncbi:hypothetical protein PHYSODRAFT_296122 [Phytophthora sojae]|uniref:Uncharacterized protein n=1 Tax=Phytophthora sojae (strain P6497) TaxID=1094619 RepID=G4YXJ2_PHYSP|nr:hypothetical protein PHYSODRAFT_296122 [Phytophthora sojae]EGZ23853.1 hypothetical protein PHYSODRAFT_296122 [Phytophthora sojae]|eukprot:XP_009519141.1 hypothetical protein PHYSODRAFT_296122 [Phytophthora sojae]